MRIFSPQDVAAALSYPDLIDALKDMFRSGCTMPLRHHHPLDKDDAQQGMLLLMPAWQKDGYLGVKMVTVMPENGSKGLPSVQGNYTLFNAVNGSIVAIMDAGELTLRRTAAASALAASYLARKTSSSLLMVGAGALAPYLIDAHRSVHPLTDIKIWNHNGDKAVALANTLAKKGLPVRAVDNLEEAARAADIISCATLSTDPIIRGGWLKPGAHLDLVGAFTPAMRECDDTAVTVTSLFVDTFEGGLQEAGDIVQPLNDGIIKKSDIKADLFGLCANNHGGRTSETEITLFKSTGAALEDLAAAILVYTQSK
ncbi:ornithine cyclodeaminase family protein [Sneathiella marina]|uniref:Ornithine cyclodeaminase family protein n=1 Tax=Sneathiella marina TaxID=2950108 RepID=A0ABY4W3G3_9PROT|nr:ornithine cyclodeaminase family protein [Sneathiella marina]USG61449.1 ornithine cyclodeaminase family protein [Sneathiella marina]